MGTGERSEFLVVYRIRHSAHEFTAGARSFTRGMLKCAFNLPGAPNSAFFNPWASELQEGVEYLNVFIRLGNYLNIPGKGTGRDRDPNVSILLDPDITRAVQQLIENAPQT
ncbi:hypothetical protein HYV72_00115 [Candidatus Uhrbacteria bacterium]|nr:hypothetical protein [Candidatus Uhrbacteria bacterium]